VPISDAGVYTFTKLRVSVHKYGSKTKFDDKNEEHTKTISSKRDILLRFTAKLSDYWINELY